MLAKNHNITGFHALSPFLGVKLGVDFELTPKLAITDYEWDYSYMMKHIDYRPCPKIVAILGQKCVKKVFQVVIFR